MSRTTPRRARKNLAGSLHIYARLLVFVRPYWRAFALAVLAMVLMAATEPLFPALMKPLLDKGFAGGPRHDLWVAPLAIIGIFLLRGIVSFAGGYLMAWVGNRVVMDMRVAMFERALALPMRYYDDQSTGALMSKILHDVTNVTGAATSALTVLVRDSLAVVGLLAWLFYLNWKLTLVALTIGPFVAVVVRAFSGRLRRASRGSQQAMGQLSRILEEAIGGQKIVKIFGGQDYEARRFFAAQQFLRGQNMRQAVAAAAVVPIVQIFTAIALAIVIYVALLQSAGAETTVGSFVSFITAMLMLLAPIKSLADVNAPIQRGLAAAESVFQLLDETPEADTGKKTIERAQGAVRYENVSFRYPGARRPALIDIDLAIAPGETVALVGASGSGKTTLANLLPRFYPLEQGRILIDGQPVETLTLASLRANIALVSQEVVLFNDTVAANIAYGALADTPQEAIEAAARAAHAHEFIMAMPQGYQTLVGERGVKLSGGQRQRIAIARALLKNAPILILDEATSALDAESERHVQAALDELMKNRTTLVIAHRLSTIEKADRIVVLDKGRIVETGTHTELLTHGGVYAKLYRLQFAEAAQ
ncbi:MAG: lipid A export permease/ATP-binding protein MsbA [Rhodocyclaceae bacterium]|nr:lipid A export permease/ATP-binding protein MsbA [Rhodocyclaceae bacterium]